MSKTDKWLLTIAAVAGCLVLFVPEEPWHRFLNIVAQLATVLAQSPLFSSFRGFF
jgi:hypothetical protein